MAVEIVATREGRTGYQGLCRRRHGPHALYRPCDRRIRGAGQTFSPILEAVMRVYNQDGRRDNIYKARIKILDQRARAGRNAPPASSANSTKSGRVAACRCQPKNWRASPPISRRREFETSCRTTMPDADDGDFADWVEDQCPCPSRARLCHRHDYPEADRAGCRAMPPPSRWTPSPI